MDEAQYVTVTGNNSSEITAHACDHCGVSGIDPSSGTEAVPWSNTTLGVVMKYRGSGVLHGSRKKCEFFKWAVKGLSKAQVSLKDSPPLSSNNSDGWMLHVVFYGAQREDRFKMKYARVHWDFLGATRCVISSLEILAQPGTLLILQNNVMFLTSK